MVKFLGRLALVSLATVCGAGAGAQAPDVSVRLMGASYFEAPPHRDKDLAIFGSGSSMEVVEAHAVAISASRHFAEIASAFEKHDITATAILPDKTRRPLGPADIGSFPKISQDARVRTINLKVTRLPDQPILGVLFEGALPMQVAKGFLKVETKFEPRVGAPLTLGDIKGSLVKVDGQTLTFHGDRNLARLRSVALRLADGRIIPAERHGYSLMNSEQTQEWKFATAAAAGTLVAEIYQPFESIMVPIRFVVGKPY